MLSDPIPAPHAKAKDDVTIRISKVGKSYQIYDRPIDRLKQSIMPRLKRLVGKTPRNYYRDFHALEDISFEVRRGETFGIIGRNGAGKSTLLQIICGTLHPTCGEVEVNGRVAALLELGSGFNPEFTGKENVYMNASILGLNKAEIDQKYEAICTFADIGEFIEQPVKSYSSGMLVRLAFSVIAHVDADILIIDEALAVGDAFFTQKCMRFLRDFMKTGTVLFVSHDTGAVLNLCNQAVCLKNGVIAVSGNPAKVVEFYLEEFYELEQKRSGAEPTSEPKPTLDAKPMETAPKALSANLIRDMRTDWINQTNLRNDIEIYDFNPESPGFGASGAKIVSVKLLDENHHPLSWVVGGEKVSLVINCIAQESLSNAIIGFQFKDRLGQIIFGDNTYLSHQQTSTDIEGGKSASAYFDFTLPVIPPGDYSISAAIAEGSQHSHIQHHWMHEALILKAHTSRICHGLVGVPMDNIQFKINT